MALDLALVAVLRQQFDQFRRADLHLHHHVFDAADEIVVHAPAPGWPRPSPAAVVISALPMPSARSEGFTWPRLFWIWAKALIMPCTVPSSPSMGATVAQVARPDRYRSSRGISKWPASSMASRMSSLLRLCLRMPALTIRATGAFGLVADFDGLLHAVLAQHLAHRVHEFARVDVGAAQRDERARCNGERDDGAEQDGPHEDAALDQLSSFRVHHPAGHPMPVRLPATSWLTSVPRPLSVKISSSRLCGTRPSMMCVAAHAEVERLQAGVDLGGSCRPRSRPVAASASPRRASAAGESASPGRPCRAAARACP
jgi:hypothetical protein